MSHRALPIAIVLFVLAAVPSMAGDKATDFSLKDTSGRTVHLSDFTGKNVVVMNFWATWCAPCQQELPLLQEIYEKYKDDGLVVLGIAVDGPASAARVKPNARKLGLTFPVLLDRQTKVISRYNPRQIMPFTLIIGRDGTIAHTHEGYSAGDEKKIEKEIAKLLAKTEAE